MIKCTKKHATLSLQESQLLTCLNFLNPVSKYNWIWQLLNEKWTDPKWSEDHAAKFDIGSFPIIVSNNTSKQARLCPYLPMLNSSNKTSLHGSYRSSRTTLQKRENKDRIKIERIGSVNWELYFQSFYCIYW